MLSTAEQVLALLIGYDLKEESPNHYRSNSPFRPGSNSHGFTLTLDDEEHGAWFDHVSQESGSLYDLAKRLGIEPPEAAPVASTKRPYKSIDDYAAAHGITSEALKKAGWYETMYQKRPALAFKTATGTRWRFLDGEKPHYVSEKGYVRSWYGLTPSAAKKLGEGAPLVLANGEISVVAARNYGVAAACVTAGEKSIPPDLMDELKTFLGGVDDAPPIIVAFDCDETGQRAGRIVARQLKEAGFIARAVNLGLGKGGDLADFCMLYTSEAARSLAGLPALDLAEQPAAPVRRSWYIIPAAELKNLPPIEWIIPGEIPARGIAVLFGASGAGKSFLALDYALKIAQELPVLYMAGEGEYGYQQRVAAWCKHHQANEGKLYICLGAVQLLETGDLDAFLQANKSIRPAIVIIDTMARSMVGSDENSTRDMGLFIQACEDLKRELDCAVLIIHHTNKGGIYERGNSALRGASDVMIKVSAEDDLIRVESAKTKDAQPFPTRYMQLLKVPVEIGAETIESAVMIAAEKMIQTPDDRLTINQQKVLSALALEIFANGATHSELAEAASVPFNSLARILSRLIGLKFVKQDGKREPYLLTPEGRAALDRYDRYDRSDHPILQSDQESAGENARDHTDQIDQTDHDQTILPGFSSPGSSAYYQAGL